MKILVDTREQKPWAFPCETEVWTLGYGDYSVEPFQDEITIERKATTAELFANVTQARFWREIEAIGSYFKKKIMICEFPESYIDIYPINSTIPKSRWRKLRTNKKLVLSRIKTRIIKDAEIEVYYTRSREEAEILAFKLLSEYYAENLRTI